MRSVQPLPRSCSLRSLALKAGALLLALAALSGCVEAYNGPVVAPSEPMFLGDARPRAVGPLKRVAESDVRIVRKDVPTGTTAVLTSSFDMDTTVRAGTAFRTLEKRFTEHKGRAARVQSLGETLEGWFRFRIDYLKDKTISVPEEPKDAKPSPVAGNSYLIELGIEDARIVADGGRIPDEDELAILREDGGLLRSLIAKTNEADSLVNTELVTQSVRRAFTREAMEVEHLKVSFMGVRSVAGVPCAIFDIRVTSVIRKSEPDASLVVRLTLAGEYARRMDDGWEAELYLTGTAITTGTVFVEGNAVQINAAGHARFHIAATYRLPDLPSLGAVAGL
jgi:hypothetical protein